jgi:hypothetical protein
VNFANGRVPEAKIVGYLLNGGHKDGGPKSRFFKAFGFTEEDWTALRDALIQHPVHNPVATIIPTPYGTKYAVICNLRTPDRRDPCVCTVWQVPDGVGSPILVTAYPA